MDSILTDTVLKAEAKVRRRMENRIPWSTTYRDARQSAFTWNKYLRDMKRTKQILVPLPAHIPITFDDALAFVQRQVTASWHTLNEIKRTAFGHRIIFLRDRIKQHENDGATKKASEVRKLLNKEFCRATPQRCP